MKRAIGFQLLILCLFLPAAPALGQADAAEAFEAGKAAFAEEDYAAARDAFAKAAETDNRNAEVFLWLGKAHYRLGELDEALEAWRRTLALSPEEPHAKRMLAALRGVVEDADTRLSLIRGLLDRNLAGPAHVEAQKLLRDEALTDAQRARALVLLGEARLLQGKPADALAQVEEVRRLYADDAPTAELLLVEGKALLFPGLDHSSALDTLRKVVAEHGGTPAAAAAELRLILWRAAHDLTPDVAEELAAWGAAHEDHRDAWEGRKTLVHAYLDLAAREAPPEADADLGEHERSALSGVTAAVAAAPSPQEARAIVYDAWKRIQARYAPADTHAALAAALEALLEPAALPRDARRKLRVELASARIELAMVRLTHLAEAGELPGGDMPDVLAAAVAACDAVNRQFPAEPIWGRMAGLSHRVLGLAGRVPWPPAIDSLKAPQQWAVEIALPVIQSHADPKAVRQALAVIAAIRSEDRPADVENRWSLVRLLAGLQERVLAAIPEESPHRAGEYWALARLAHEVAQAEFARNVSDGRDEANAELSDAQKTMIDALARVLENHAAKAPEAASFLRDHLAPWVARNHYAAAEAAYEALLPALREPEQRRVRLEIAALRARQVHERHRRLLAAGRTVPAELDLLHVQAIEMCYSLQADLPAGAPELNGPRRLWNAIIRHYEALELHEVAEAAVLQRPAQAVPNANAWAALRLAALRRAAAEREMRETLAEFKGDERIELTDAFQEALAAYRSVITDHPDSGLVHAAANGVFRVGRLFQERGAYDVAVRVYREFAEFADDRPRLAQSGPGAAGVAERARYAAASALDAKANDALNELLAEREPDDPPPAELSEEYAAAIEAHTAIITARPRGPLAHAALRRILSVALAYARADAWDVAEGVFADLRGAGLELRRPERLDLARGVCKLGPVLPDHARQMLQALAAPAPVPDLPGIDGLHEREEAWGATFADDGELSVKEDTAAGLGFFGSSGEENDGRWDTSFAGETLAPDTNKSMPEPPAAPHPPGETELPALRRPAESESAERPADELRQSDRLAAAAIRQSHAQQAAQVARLRGRLTMRGNAAGGRRAEEMPFLSEAELARWEAAFDAAYQVFQAIRKAEPASPTAEQARGEILLMADRWRTAGEWQRAAQLTERYLADNPRDPELPQLQLKASDDYLAWASEPVESRPSKQEMLAEVAERFATARERLADIVERFEDRKPVVHEAQWSIAASWLTQARVVHGFSAVLARGQYVRAADEVRQVAGRFPQHPKIGEIPNMLWQIAEELAARGYHDEAIEVWTDLTVHYPTHSQALQARYRIAQTYQNRLGRPLKAAEAYMELNFARADDAAAQQNIQDTIFGIGAQLKNEQRWVEALHVLESFVASFPKHARAGEALTMVGQIHQSNQAWQDAIAAYERVILEFPEGQWVRTAKWAIAECTINLSQWREATLAYYDYLKAYPGDANKPEAERRIGILKDLSRYQALVDEEDHKKAFDAQYQIAEIVLKQLSNRVKAIIEYRKVTEGWPESHLADDALHQVGVTYLAMNKTGPAREALRRVAAEYPNSPLADDAMFRVGQSYEDEAKQLSAVTRAESRERAQLEAQHEAYSRFTQARSKLSRDVAERVSELEAGGKGEQAELEAARGAAQLGQFSATNAAVYAEQAGQEMQQMTARELADRQDKINAALREAVEAYDRAAKTPAADKADDALLRMAVIYAEKLDDSELAMKTYEEIVRQFSGTAVAEDASWRIARHYERQAEYDKAIEAYKAFLRNYRRSDRAGQAQFAVAENYERQDKWVDAMDAYKNYITNFPEGPLVEKAREQINWIEKYRL